MTLRQLLEDLQRLPASALDATVDVAYTEGGEMGIAPELGGDLLATVEYEGGVVRLITEAADGFNYEDDEED